MNHSSVVTLQSWLEIVLPLDSIGFCWQLLGQLSQILRFSPYSTKDQN